MSATGLLALNFCDLILLITSEVTSVSRSLETEEISEQKYSNYVTLIEEVPYHVLIAYQNLYCSGSLIKSKIVVTAASCFVKMTSSATVIVKVGASTMTDIGQVIEVLEVKKHEYFGRGSDLNNDIALLVLKDHVKFSNNVMKIALMEDQELLDITKVGVHTIVTVCGWGSTNLEPKYTNRLLCTDMAVINNTECWKMYNVFMNGANYCVKYPQKFRLSDNGGPVVYKERLIGIMSYGADRVIKPFIALATNTTPYNKWINVNVQRFLLKYCKPIPEYEYYYSTESESSAFLSTTDQAN